MFARKIKVGRPAPWKKHRKKLQLKFGELGHILIIYKKRKELLKKEYGYLDYYEDVDGDELFFESERERAEELERGIEYQKKQIEVLLEEMKYKRKLKKIGV